MKVQTRNRLLFLMATSCGFAAATSLYFSSKNTDVVEVKVEAIRFPASEVEAKAQEQQQVPAVPLMTQAQPSVEKKDLLPIETKTEPLKTACDPQDAKALPQAETKSESSSLTLYLSAGANYFQYEEDLSTVQTKYNGFKLPSLAFGVTVDVDKGLSYELRYKTIPLTFDNSSVGFAKTEANWQMLSLQVSLRSEKLSKIDPGLLSEKPFADEFRWLFGLQLHDMPLALFENVGGQPALRNIQLLNASLGASYRQFWTPHTRSHVELRLQYPVSTSTSDGSASLSVKPVVILDGSVGVDKKIGKSTWLGIHWSGQYQKIDLRYLDAKVTAEGKHTVLISSAEVRLSLDF